MAAGQDGISFLPGNHHSHRGRRRNRAQIHPHPDRRRHSAVGPDYSQCHLVGRCAGEIRGQHRLRLCVRSAVCDLDQQRRRPQRRRRFDARPDFRRHRAGAAVLPRRGRERDFRVDQAIRAQPEFAENRRHRTVVHFERAKRAQPSQRDGDRRDQRNLCGRGFAGIAKRGGTRCHCSKRPRLSYQSAGSEGHRRSRWRSGTRWRICNCEHRAPLSCLLSWFQQTGDSRPVDKYLTGYTDAFRQLEAINTQMNLPTTVDERKMQETRLNEITSDFVRNGLTMALDVALSTTQKDVLKACGKWFEVYCPPDNKPAADKPDSGVPLQQCLRSELKQFADPSVWPKTGKVGERIASLTTGLKEFVTPQGSVDTRGLEMLPYFAIGRASLMAQLGQHEAAAAILDGWLQRRAVENGLAEKQKAFTSNPILKIKDDWFALRVRAMLISYVEEWLGDKETNAASVVQTEHLENLRATRDGFKSRLLKADFFNELDKSCRPRCEPVFRRPAECNSDQPSERLALWRKLYSSYITMEYTYIHRALAHPDYQAKFAESVNDEARRLVNYDLSCGIDQPRPEVIYGQSLLGFVENALSYSRVRAGVDSEDAQIKRLDEAERAAKFGLEIVEAAAAEDQERTGKPYLERIAPSFAVQVQEQLKMQLKRIRQAQKNVAE